MFTNAIFASCAVLSVASFRSGSHLDKEWLPRQHPLTGKKQTQILCFLRIPYQWTPSHWQCVRMAKRASPGLHRSASVEGGTQTDSPRQDLHVTVHTHTNPPSGPHKPHVSSRTIEPARSTARSTARRTARRTARVVAAMGRYHVRLHTAEPLHLEWNSSSAVREDSLRWLHPRSCETGWESLSASRRQHWWRGGELWESGCSLSSCATAQRRLIARWERRWRLRGLECSAGQDIMEYAHAGELSWRRGRFSGERTLSGRMTNDGFEALSGKHCGCGKGCLISGNRGDSN